MRATAIVPVKRFDEAKRRLSGTEAEAHRPVLARAMLDDVLLGLNESRLVDRIVVVSGEPAAIDAATESGAEHLDDPADAGHSEAAAAGIAEAMARGDECATLVAADCPLLDSFELDRELDAQAPGVAVIPDRHGTGTNGLILTPPDAILPAFGPGSRERHLELARTAGVRCRIATIPSMALDLDTGDDLRKLVLALVADPERAPATAAALQQLGETGL
jgi:2-phospho-L-lactate/phosphoenolpyruvate guanylyltransferase